MVAAAFRTGFKSDAQILTRIEVFVLLTQVNDVAGRVEGFDVQAQRAHFLDEDSEGLGDAGLGGCPRP